MSQQSNGGDVIFQFMIYVVVAGVLLTWIGNIWIHWIAILAAFIVGGWAIQSAGKQKIKDDHES